MKLGMEDGSISKNQLGSSSGLSSGFHRNNARLHTTNGNGAWAPKESDSNPYLQVDFKEMKVIIGIYTQGCHGEPYYVKSYRVSHCNDNEYFQLILGQNGDPKVRIQWSILW